MSKDSLDGLQAEQFANFRRRRVAELIGRPVGNLRGILGIAAVGDVLAESFPIGLGHRPPDGVVVGVGCVRLAGFFLRSAFAIGAGPVAATERGFPQAMTDDEPLFLALRGNETERILWPQQVWAKNFLGLWTDEDDPLMVPIFRFVMLRDVDPHRAGRIDVARPHGADFSGACSDEAVEADHIGHHRGQVGERGFDHLIGDGPDGRAFGGRGASLTEAGNGLDRPINGLRDQLLGDAPFEDAFDLVNDMVAVSPTAAGCGQFLLNRLEGEGTEVFGEGVGVGVLQRADGDFDPVQGTGGLAVHRVVALGEAPVAKTEFCDGKITSRRWDHPTRRKPLCDDPIVLRATFDGPVPTQIKVFPVNSDHRLPARPMKPIRRNPVTLRHACTLNSEKW